MLVKLSWSVRGPFVGFVYVVDKVICKVPVADLPTLLVFPGVSKFFIKSPSLPVRAPNLPGTNYHGSFYIFFH